MIYVESYGANADLMIAEKPIMETRTYDVIVVGGSGAGVTAAASAARFGASVAILCKEPVACGNTRIAYGGFAGVGMSSGDSADEFLKDMLAAGKGLGSAPLTRKLTQDALAGLSIAEGMGHLFRRDADGEIKGEAVTAAGGHWFNRNVSSPAQGVSLGSILHDTALASGVDILEEILAFRLLGDGRVEGLTAFSLRNGKMISLTAGAIILATGGAGWLYYPHTDCTRASTGDGMALALDAGAELIGMEFMQFLPFAVTHPSSYVGIFLGEPSGTGPHGRLVNSTGETVLTQMRRKTRAQVATAIALQMAAGNTTEHGGIRLELSANLETAEGRTAWESTRKTGLLEQARLIYGSRAYRFEEPWDVAPTAHFSVGGIRIDETCRSSVEGLYAAGEVAGGVHGADRLGGTSLTEVFLFGWKAGESAASYALGRTPTKSDSGDARNQARRVEAMFGNRKRRRPVNLIRALQKLMWEQVGVVRTDSGLRRALSELDALEEEAGDLQVMSGSVYNMELQEALELEMMLRTARAMALSALERTESRGGHVRLDYPEQDDENWLQNLVIRKESGSLKLRAEKVATWKDTR